MFRWIKKALGGSPTLVTKAPGVPKIHNIEARFRSDALGHRSLYGKLSQDRWGDGQERFSLVSRNLPRDHDGKVQLFHKGALVSEFDAPDASLKFRWKGYSSDDIPLFAIGDQVTIQAGSLVLNAIVEAD